MAKLFIQLAALNGALAVMIGAFGAHALKARLTPELLNVYETGVQYHFWHSLALLAVGLLALQLPDSRALIASGITFIVGIILFSGSLYLLASTDIRQLGFMPVGLITPFGGMSFIIGWLLLLISSFKI
ncbi:MAG TPA: DUF423 domain-containing protein [Cellvibrionales bacterium]|jgi:uncharacterized membrane protein YgdD (TMEM256/DUF423 family)|nr:DUF423 domain-containing protein [Cellvibrionales bacterium]HAW14265.1 DUF423 domain-containing protein [Cellvibrionales bacterium]HCX26393.1 DUF423 domain-containing protein [Cellvibrionales bacterium]